MKYTTFRNIVGMVVFLALGGSCYACYGCAQKELTLQKAKETQAKADAEERARQQAVEVKKLQAQALTNQLQPMTAVASPGSFWSKAQGLSASDKDALALLQRPVVDKIKDGTRGKPYKINVYSDDGKRFNRLKVDLDRDEKDDESWTISADGRIERKRSSKDDGNNDVHERLELSGWTSGTAAATPPPTTTTTATPAGGGRPVDNDMFHLRGALPVTSDKIKDATKGKPYKINLYSDDNKVWNRAKVDLNRNDKWDESWTWKADGSVERQVAPKDDEKYTETYRWQGGAWLKK